MSIANHARGVTNSAVGALGALLFGGVVLGSSFAPQAVVQESTVNAHCGTSSAAQLRTTLYFGLARAVGSVSELEWQMFLRGRNRSRVRAMGDGSSLRRRIAFPGCISTTASNARANPLPLSGLGRKPLRHDMMQRVERAA